MNNKKANNRRVIHQMWVISNNSYGAPTAVLPDGGLNRPQQTFKVWSGETPTYLSTQERGIMEQVLVVYRIETYN